MERLRFMQVVMGALRDAVPDLPPTKPPLMLALADRRALEGEMRSGGFAKVNVFSVTRVWTFRSPEEVFEGLPSVSPTFSLMLDALQPEGRAAFRKTFVQRVRRQGDGPYGLEGEAHIAVGVK